MKKLVSVLFIVMCLFSQETRVISMGGIGNFMEDFSNIHTYSGSILKHDNFASIEIGSPKDFDTYSFTTKFNINESSAISIFLNRPVSANLSGMFNLSSSLELKKQSEIYYSIATEDKAMLSFGVLFGGDGTNLTLDQSGKTIERSTSVSDFGIRTGFSNGFLDADIQYHFLNASSKDDDGNDATTNDPNNTLSGGTFLSTFRIKSELSSKLSFFGVTHFRNAKNTYDEENTLNFFERKYSHIAFGLGAGFNYSLNDQNIFVAAVELYSFRNYKTATSDEVSDRETERYYIQYPSLYFGVESFISKYFVARAGINQTYLKSGNKSDINYIDENRNDRSSDASSFSSDFSSVFGLGLHFENFKLDFLFNEGLLFKGPNFLTGADEDVSSRMSVSYLF